MDKDHMPQMPSPIDENGVVTFPTVTEDEAKELRSITERFIESYKAKGELSDEVWLARKLGDELPELSAEESEHEAKGILSSIQVYDAEYKDITEAAAKGVSSESWLESKLREGSSAMSVQDYGYALAQIDANLTAINENMAQALSRQYDGAPNMNPRLHGNIAEEMHAASAQANAVFSGSDISVKVQHSNNANSVDIQLFTPGSGHPAQNYQLKFCKTAQETYDAIRAGDYRNQRIIVPKDQLADIKQLAERDGFKKTITDHIDYKGNKSEAHTYDEFVEMRDKWQKEGIPPTITYNDISAKEIAKQIGRQSGAMALQSAALATGFDIAYKLWNGQEIKGEELAETAINAGADAGFKACVSGGLAVAIRRGIIKCIPPSTPPGIIANVACVAVENTKILWRWVKGEISFSDALEGMRRTTTVMVYGLGGAAVGAAKGAAAGMLLAWIPVIGPAFPVIGGILGGMIGYVAGSKIGEKLYQAGKTFREKVYSVAKTTWNTVKSVGNKVYEGVKSVASTVVSGVKNVASKVGSFLFGY